DLSPQVVLAQPGYAKDADVERARHVVALRISGEREAQKCCARVRRLPSIDADERGDPHMPTGFLERFANGGGGQRFSELEMARRLIDPRAVSRLLLDEEKTALRSTTVAIVIVG